MPPVPDNPGHGAVNPDAEPLVSELAGNAEMAELVDFFLAELHDRVNTVIEAFEHGDEQRLKQVAHQLRGAAACYGFPVITDSAGKLEEALAEEAEASAIQEQVEELITLCRRAAAA